MKTTGTKAELLMRLQNSGNSAIDNTIITINNDISNNNLDGNSNSNSISDIDKITLSKMTVKDLQILCREKKLPVSGNKQSIIDRLVQFDSENNNLNSVNNNVNNNNYVNNNNVNIESNNNSNDSNDSPENNSMYTVYNNMDKKSLIDICRSKCLSSSGTKEQLIDTLMRDDMAANDTVTTEDSFVQCFNEGLRKEIPLYTIQPPAKKYREIR